MGFGADAMRAEGKKGNEKERSELTLRFPT